MQATSQNGVLPSGQTFAVVTSPQQNKAKSNRIDHYLNKQALVLGIIQVMVSEFVNTQTTQLMIIKRRNECEILTLRYRFPSPSSLSVMLFKRNLHY